MPRSEHTHDHADTQAQSQLRDQQRDLDPYPVGVRLESSLTDES